MPTLPQATDNRQLARGPVQSRVNVLLVLGPWPRAPAGGATLAASVRLGYNRKDFFTVEARMASQSLYRKWRSQTFNELIGQEHVVQTLRNAIVEQRVSHTYLFTGPRGVGKTSMARLLAKAVNCSDADPAAR